MNICTIAYVPPPTYGHPESFLTNLAAYPTVYPLILASDYDWEGTITQKFLKHGPNIVKFIKLKTSPEVARTFIPKEDPNQQWIVNNTIFLTCLSIMNRDRYNHFIYLEEDCRVGREKWDEFVFDEFYNVGRPLICAGSLVVYNPTNAGPIAHRRWCELVSQNIRKNYPIPTYGFIGAAKDHPSCVFPNGALGVYDTLWLMQLMKESFNSQGIEVPKLRGTWAWDFYLGEKIWLEFGAEAYDMVEHLGCVFSGYGNVLTTEQDRINMLKAGKVVGIHQVKSDWTL